MVIGVDATCWGQERGYGRFTRELLRALVPAASGERFVVFLDSRSQRDFDLAHPNLQVIVVPQRVAPTEAAAADRNRSLHDLLRMTRAVAGTELDVFFCPTVYSYFPLPPRLPSLVAIHDTIPERFPELTLPSRRSRLLWGLKVKLAVNQARLILTVSRFSARDIARTFRVAPARIRIAEEAPAPEYAPSESAEAIAGAAASVGLPPGARWFTYVGGINPHKNVDAIVRAHATLVRENGGRAPFLLLIGAVQNDVFHGNAERIRDAIAREGTGSLVKWTGFVDDAQLRHLHSGAIALLLPSRIEGFGLPAIEAAACGTPVIATRESPLPDLLAGGGVFIDPADEPSLTASMRLLATREDVQRDMGQRALERARLLSWERAAGVTLDALREAAA